MRVPFFYKRRAILCSTYAPCSRECPFGKQKSASARIMRRSRPKNALSDSAISAHQYLHKDGKEMPT